MPPDEAGVIRILMQVKHVDPLSLRNGLIDLQQRKLLRLCQQRKPADPLAAFKDALLFQQAGDLADIACVCAGALRDLLGAHRPVGSGDHDQHMDCR